MGPFLRRFETCLKGAGLGPQYAVFTISKEAWLPFYWCMADELNGLTPSNPPQDGLLIVFGLTFKREES